jgi:hypothetical protein
MSNKPYEEINIPTEPKSKIDREVKRPYGFGHGFILSFGVVLFLWLVKAALYQTIVFYDRINRGGILMLENPILYNRLLSFFNILPFIIYAGVIIYLLRKHPRMVFGMLTAGMVIAAGYWLAFFAYQYLLYG